ncbi:hypothetical protein CV770_31465 [Bradyrhizobium sp. AC87j1]|nr:hypothetical protein CV770_31465 [Bradyrhizobium sp. AC87j1]
MNRLEHVAHLANLIDVSCFRKIGGQELLLPAQGTQISKTANITSNVKVIAFSSQTRPHLLLVRLQGKRQLRLAIGDWQTKSE